MDTSKLAIASSVPTNETKPAEGGRGANDSINWVDTVIFGGGLVAANAFMAEMNGEDISPLFVLGGCLVFVVGLGMKARDFIRARRARERAIVGNGAALLRFPKSRKGVFVSARVNGIEARFLVDTGAMATFIPDDLARRANIVETGGEREVRLADGGKMRMKAARAETIMVQNANVRNLEVMICTPKAATSWGEGGAGILGMTFLEHFDMRICNGVLELKPLGAK